MGMQSYYWLIMHACSLSQMSIITVHSRIIRIPVLGMAAVQEWGSLAADILAVGVEGEPTLLYSV
jgi:hypothetical protein